MTHHRVITLLIDINVLCIFLYSLIYQTTEPTAVIVLEDLGSYGFATICAPDQNLETTKMIFYRLAIFHAASFFLADNVRMLCMFLAHYPKKRYTSL